VTAEVKLGEGYHLLWGGQFENQQRAAQRLAIVVPIALSLIFCCFTPPSIPSAKRYLSYRIFHLR